MNNLIISYLLSLSILSPCQKKGIIELISKYYSCYECNNGELKKIIDVGKSYNCIFENLTKNLENGPSKYIQKEYELSIRDTYSEVKLNADSLFKKYNFNLSENEVVKNYLENQKAAYQIRSIEPMFQIDKAKTIPIIKDFIAKANNNPNYARKDVVDYAQARLTYYQSQK